jgi:spore coat polysaccharide biosynthesis protein SpsF
VILAIVQARCSSTRLPGKVLKSVQGEPMIVRQLERVERARRIDQIVVATSTDPSDDELVDLLKSRGTFVRRGPLGDVAERFAGVVAEFAPDSIVRLTADCPLADHGVIDTVIGEHLSSGADYTSNVIYRTFPQGLDVECVTTATFSTLLGHALDAAEREHVTLGIYNRPEEFSLHSVVQPVDRSALRWTVDRQDDLDFVRSIFQQLYPRKPDFTQADVLELIERIPSLRHVN